MSLLRLLAVLLLLTAPGLSSCSKGQEPMPAPLYLLDQPWQLTEQLGQPVNLVGGGSATLTLSSLSSAGAGRMGKTAYRTRFLLVGGTDNLLFTSPSQPAGTNYKLAQTTSYLTLLPQVRRYSITHRQLQLFDSEHAQPVLVFAVQ